MFNSPGNFVLFFLLGTALLCASALPQADYEDDDDVVVVEHSRQYLPPFQIPQLPAIFPIINGIPCFNLNETSEFRSSSGDSVTCTCRKATRSELPVIRSYRTWNCDSKSDTSAGFPRITSRPSFNQPKKTTTKKTGYFGRRKSTTPATTKSSLDIFDYFSTTPKRRFQIGGVTFPTWAPRKTKAPASSSPKPGSGGGGSFGNYPEAGGQGQGGQQPDPGCSYCTLPSGSTEGYKCVPAYSYECLNELRRLEYNQRLVQCMDDTWTYSNPTRICYSQDTYQQIYLVIGTRPGTVRVHEIVQKAIN